jgi:hypothetical protein
MSTVLSLIRVKHAQLPITRMMCCLLTPEDERVKGWAVGRKAGDRLVDVLRDAGIRISAVVSDPHGVAATAMIDCLLEGGTPEQALQHAGRLRAPREELLAALDGDLSGAIVAIGHKVLKTVVVLLSRNVPYQDSTMNYQALAVKRNAPRWIKALRQYNLLPHAPGSR